VSFFDQLISKMGKECNKHLGAEAFIYETADKKIKKNIEAIYERTNVEVSDAVGSVDSVSPVLDVLIEALGFKPKIGDLITRVKSNEQFVVDDIDDSGVLSYVIKLRKYESRYANGSAN
jgi:hypothetical protein